MTHFDVLPEELGKKYETVLAREVGVPEHKRSYFRKWLSEFLGFCRVRGLGESEEDSLEFFVEGLRKAGRRGFQIEQARLAVQIYRDHFGIRSIHGDSTPQSDPGIVGPVGPGIPLNWALVYSNLEKEIRFRHFSSKTLKSYGHWVRAFSKFVGLLPPNAVTAEHVREFLSFLASERNVSASTQNQAFNALLFFCGKVLGLDLEGLDSTPRAKKGQMIPTVLTRSEVQKVLSGLENPYRLFCQLLYGCGLRLNEGLGLRIQDLDLEAHCLRVQFGKGNKSRTLPLPKTLVPALSSHLQSLRGILESDLRVGFAGVPLPEALERKLPGASRSWPWQWVFPGGRLSLWEGDGKLRRFHLHESGVQKEIKRAADAMGISKRVTAHAFRHSYATHLLQMGYDIRTVQNLLGHRDLSTTMIYTHVVQSMSGKVISPLDV